MVLPENPARAHLEKPSGFQSRTFMVIDFSTYADQSLNMSSFSANPTPSRSALHTLMPSVSSAFPWIFGSDCTSCATHDCVAFNSYHSFRALGILDLGAGSPTQIVGSGVVQTSLRTIGSSIDSAVSSVLHVQFFRSQLLSVSAMAKLCTRVRFDTHHAKRFWTNYYPKSDYSSSMQDSYPTRHLWHTNLLPVPSLESSSFKSLSIWHQRLANVDSSIISTMARLLVATEINNARTETSK